MADGRERVTAFQIGDELLFKQYFDAEALYDRLKPFYNHSQYRFELPVDRREPIESALADHGYELRVVDAPEKYVVVVEQYTAHPENIFKESVLQRQAEGYNCFLMTDEYAVARAVAAGATRLIETDLSVPFER